MARSRALRAIYFTLTAKMSCSKNSFRAFPRHDQVSEWIDSGVRDLVAGIKARLERGLACGI
jgi:hypothetical protein